ncbi:hypothetical protein D3C83_13590 [compost metagenome]
MDLLRAAGKEGVLRVERDRQGAVRVFPGTNLAPRPAAAVDEPLLDDDQSDVEGAVEPDDAAVEMAAEPVGDPPIVDAEALVSPPEDDDEGDTIVEAVSAEPPVGAGKRGARKRKSPAARAPRAAKAAKPPARPRGRKTARGKDA